MADGPVRWPEHPLWTKRFERFRANPAVASLAGVPNWSISDPGKRPLDVNRLEYDNMADRGASPSRPWCLRTLDRMRAIVPNAANYAFALDAPRDRLVVVDVESTCPPGLKRRLLDMEGILYAEESLSGKGLHLLMAVEDWMSEYPAAAMKTKLQADDRSFEVLRCHWVTFTLEEVAPGDGSVPARELLEPLFQRATESVAQTHEFSVADLDGVPDGEYLVKVMSEAGTFRRTPEDYQGDMSRFEGAFLFHYAGKLYQHLCTDRIRRNGHDYAFDEKVAVLAALARRDLEHRDKHDEARPGGDYIEYSCVRALNDYEAKNGPVPER